MTNTFIKARDAVAFLTVVGSESEIKYNGNMEPFCEMHNLNRNLENMESDFLCHLGFSTSNHNLQDKFGDVKFVCMGGAATRMRNFAYYIKQQLGSSDKVVDLCTTGRFSLYKIGPVISVNHGMGMPSMSILLHELIKLVYYAKCVDPIFIRIGTSGGIGVDPGTVIVTKDAFNGKIRNEHETIILGKSVIRPANFDLVTAEELTKCSLPGDPFKTILGNTMAADDFYEGQGRLDGAVCNYSEADKMAYLYEIYKNGIRNIEMEASMFAALTKYMGIKAADVCVTLLNRLEGDQVPAGAHDFDDRPQIIVGRFIKKMLS